jgi:hypothetical protein
MKLQTLDELRHQAAGDYHLEDASDLNGKGLAFQRTVEHLHSPAVTTRRHR